MHTTWNDYSRLAFIQANKKGDLAEMQRLYPAYTLKILTEPSRKIMVEIYLTALTDITQDTNLDALEWLLSQLAPYCVSPPLIQEAIYNAIFHKRLDIVSYLWNITVNGCLGLTEDDAMGWLQDDDYRLFHYACENGNLETVEFLYDTAYIYKIYVPPSVLEQGHECAQSDEVTTWLEHKGASIGHPIEPEWIMVSTPLDLHSR